MMALGRGKRAALVVAALMLIGAVVAFRALRLGELARIGAGYVAQQTCACRFIAGRSAQSCVSDLEPLAKKIVHVREGADEITASTLGIAHATARYERGFGCSLRN